MKLTPEQELLVYVAGKLNESLTERDSAEHNERRKHFYRGRVSAYAIVLDKARELGMPVASAQYLANPQNAPHYGQED